MYLTTTVSIIPSQPHWKPSANCCGTSQLIVADCNCSENQEMRHSDEYFIWGKYIVQTSGIRANRTIVDEVLCKD